MLQGDPRGSLKAGTIKCLAEAALQTDENEASYVSGSEHERAGATVFVGLRIRAVVRPADQQRVHLKLKVERSDLTAPTGERALIQTDQVLFNERVTLDSKTKLTFGAPSDRPWVEVVVTEGGG